jgi:putative ABC transport system ATP-binding protein
MSYLIEASGIYKEFSIGSSVISVLKGIDIHVKREEFVAIMGPSGSGKSTLLYILGCLDRPTSGTYLLDGRDVFGASDRELSRIRANRIGFVFQTFNLLPHLNLFENVELPFFYFSFDDHGAKERVMTAVQRVGLADRLRHKPAELSGGEMQRVAIARALVIEPALILADEPTGNVDSKTSLEILELFQKLNDSGSTIVMVTHDSEVASHAQRVLILKDGKFI